MKKFMSVRVTICEGSCINGGFIYYSDDEDQIELAYETSYEAAMKELRKLEKRLGKVATLTINEFDRAIAYKEVYGYLDK